MILRKPYAFFIKHFKFIHLILAILVSYSVYKTKLLLDFFNEYSNEVINIVGQDLVTPLLPFTFQILPFIVLVFILSLLILMIVKKKPYIFYIVSIGIFVYAAIILQISKSTLNSLFFAMVDVRTIRLIHDLIAVSFFTQLFSFVFIVIRAIGFDIKKFDFKRDLKEIEINEEDREEVEIQINFDTNKGIRNIRKQIRFLKYAYKEHRLLFNLVGAGTILSCIIIFSLVVFKTTPSLKQNIYFNTSIFSVNIENSYLVNTDYQGNVLNDDYNYLILQVKMKNNTLKEQKLDIATTKIQIKNYIYTPTLKYKDSFFDFGKVYQNTSISKEYEDIVLVYEIPKQIVDEKIIFSFVDKIGVNKLQKTNVEIKYQNLMIADKINTVNINNILKFEDSILPNYGINIFAFDIQKKYKLDYNFCISDKCYPSVEYLTPDINTNYDKSLLKINGTLEKDKLINGVYTLYDFINSFGKLKYTINGEEKIQNIQFKEVKSKHKFENNTYYLEILSEVKDASNISFIFNIRNKNYEYILK